MKARRGFYNLIAVIVLIAATLIALISGVGNAYAATTRYSGVLEDLQQDSNFNVADYPAVNDDYSLKVIQVAESTADELFLYVYQPAARSKFLKATQINMSLSETAENTQLYKLTYLNGAGVFQKYRVDEFTVRKNKTFRFYNISAIYRAFNSSIDGDADKQEGDNITNDIAFQVGKVFTASTIEGKIIYDMEPIYTVQIINPVTDYLTHVSGYNAADGLWWIQAGNMEIFDSHFIAFSTDWDIDRLISATVSYYVCSGTAYYDEVFGFEKDCEVNYGKDKEAIVTLNADEKFEHTNSINGYTYATYAWNKINSTSDFIAAVRSAKGLSHNNAYNNLESILYGSEWVLNFVETERTQHDTNVLGVYKKYTSEFSKVSNVTILRLEFEANGKVYNLGAVSNIVSSTNYPEEVDRHWYDGITNFFKRIKDFFTNLTWWHWLLLIIAIVVIVALIIAIIKFGIGAVINLIGLLIKKLAQAVWWVICLPFRGIAALIRKRKEAAPAKVAPSKSRKTRTPKKKTRTSRTKTPRTSRKK